MNRVRELIKPYLEDSNSQHLNQALLDYTEPLCDPIGFWNHRGECWNDSLQEIFLFADGLKEYTQPLLFSLNTASLHDRIAESIAHTGDITEETVEAYVKYIILLKTRFVTHYKYIQATQNQIVNESFTASKRRLSTMCGVGAAAQMITLFKGASNTYKPGIKSANRNMVFTNLCSIFNIPFVVAPITSGFQTSHVAFIISSIAFQPLTMTSYGGHVVSALRCNGVWYWYDDNKGVFEITESMLRLCLAESEFGFYYKDKQVHFIRTQRVKTPNISRNMLNTTDYVEKGGFSIKISHTLMSDGWIPLEGEFSENKRIHSVKVGEGVFAIRPKRTVAQIMRNRTGKQRVNRKRSRTHTRKMY